MSVWTPASPVSSLPEAPHVGPTTLMGWFLPGRGDRDPPAHGPRPVGPGRGSPGASVQLFRPGRHSGLRPGLSALCDRHGARGPCLR